MLSKLSPKKPYDEQRGLRYVLTIACVVLFVILLAWAVVLLWRAIVPETQWFRISRIKVVTDAKHLSTRNIASQISQHMDGGFFTIELSTLRKLLIAMPWVADVSFRRQWPGTLQVTVIEEKPLAIWADKHLLNQQGQVFSPPVSSFPKHLPQLSGPEESLDRVLHQYFRLSQLLATVNLSPTRVVLTKYGNWEFVANNIKVILGHEAIQQRLDRFIALYSKVIARRGNTPWRVDLRYPNGAAVQQYP